MSKPTVNTNFSYIWPFTDSIPGSFTHLNGEKLYEYACQVPDGGTIVEVGVDQGRSASVLMAAIHGRRIALVLVDSWESVLIDNKAKVERLVAECADAPYATVIHGMSVHVAPLVTGAIDLIHIDANHYAPNPALDCEAWLPKLVSGGVACFHDCQSTFPAVDDAVAKYCAGWEDLGIWDGLGIRRKP